MSIFRNCYKLIDIGDPDCLRRPGFTGRNLYNAVRLIPKNHRPAKIPEIRAFLAICKLQKGESVITTSSFGKGGGGSCHGFGYYPIVTIDDQGIKSLGEIADFESNRIGMKMLVMKS